jgi:flavin-dependent dehydrogenase
MDEPAREDWDVVVVGAGVAGAVAAARLARRGCDVLLVEKSSWPRDKVCGGCVNRAARAALASAGLDTALAAARPYSAMRLAFNGREARFALPDGRAISRRRLDAALVDAAVAAGARFMSGARAVLDRCEASRRRVTLHQGREAFDVCARVVLACDGLKGRMLGDKAEIAAGARIGVGVTVAAPAADYAPGIIHMASTAQGYVGLVRVEDGLLNIGAALDPAWTKRMGGPPAAVRHVLDSAQFAAVPELDKLRWRGTPRLTRRHRRLGAERLLALGDAAGYVEPFTGEGMAWAIAGAAAVEPFAAAAVAGWRDALVEQWTARHRALIGRRQRLCGGIAWTLRRPRLLSNAVRLAARAPLAATPVTAWLNRGYNPPGYR